MTISNLKLNEETGKYIITSELSSDEIIETAKKLLNNRLRRGAIFKSPTQVTDYLEVHFQ